MVPRRWSATLPLSGILLQVFPMQLRNVQPSSIVHLNDSIPPHFQENMTVSQVISRSGTLHFVVSSKSRIGVLRTDMLVRRQSWVVLPDSLQHIRSFDVDEDGNTYFLQDDALEPHGQTLTTFDVAGILVMSRRFPEFVDKVCWSGHTLIGVSGGALFVVGDRMSEPTKHAYPGFTSGYPLFVAPMPDGRVLIADSVDAEIRIVRPMSGETVVLRPQHPGIQPDPAQGLGALGPVITNENGFLFVPPGPYRLGHTIILQLNEHGDVEGNFDVVLPVVSQEPGWKRSLQRDALAVSDHNLYVLDRRGIVATYSLSLR